MADKLTIDNVVVIAVSLNNGAPISGEVSFSDGKNFEWSSYDDEIRFHTRRMPGGYQRLSFASHQRAVILLDWLNTKDWSVSVIEIS
jgi:hypothetical protein